MIVADDLNQLAAGKSYIRYINAIPDSSQSNVIINAGGTDIVNQQAAFASVSSFSAVTPGAVTITVNNGGTVNVNRTITLENNKVYTVLLVGEPGSGSTPVEIRYIVNGVIDDAASGRMAGSASAIGSN